MTVEIIKGFGMPGPHANQKKYPWDDLEVGDAIQVPGYASNYNYALARKASAKFAPKEFKATTRDGLRYVVRVK